MCRCGSGKWKTAIYLLVQRAESRWFLCRAPSPFSSTWLSCSGTRPATKQTDEHQSTRCITSQIGSIQQIKLRAKEQNNLSTTAQSAIGAANRAPVIGCRRSDIKANDTKESSVFLVFVPLLAKISKSGGHLVERFE